jgi:uncharacterized membrane protein YgcG
VAGYLDKVLALAVVRVPEYQRRSAKGGAVSVASYSRMGRDAMQSHLTSSHRMDARGLGADFSHPANLAAWHGADHVARGDGLDHQHPEGIAAHADHAVAHESEHGHGLGAIVGHAAVAEGPAIAHRELRREADRQTRRRAYRVISKHKGGSKKRPGGGFGSGAASGASGSSSGGGGSSGGSGGSSGSSGGNSQ